MAQDLISIIMVNFNGGRFLQAALDAVAEQTDQDYEFLLVDNASTDGSLEGLQTEGLQRFQLIQLDTNIGFAAANNRAVQRSHGAWVALLNPDTKAAPDWLAQYREALEAFPDEVMFAGSTLNMSEPEKLDGAGDNYFFAGAPWRGGYGRPSSELPLVGECFSPCGASALFKRETFLDIGGFDERFFCYCEDVDLGFRLRLAGYRCIFWPEARALHYGSGTTHLGSAFAVRHGTRNRLWVFVKNMPPLGFWLLLPAHILLTAVLILRGYVRGCGGATVQGLREGVSQLGAVWKDRQRVQRSRKLGTFQMLKAMSLNPFLFLQRKTDVRPLNDKSL